MAKKKARPTRKPSAAPIAVKEENGRPIVEHLDEQGLPIPQDGCGHCEQRLETGCAHCGSTFADAKEVQAHQAHTACGKWLKLGSDPRLRAFTEMVKVPAPDPGQQAARSQACVHLDRGQHILLELSRNANSVHVVERLDDGRFALATHELKAFEAKYQPIVDYPTGRAATLLIEFTTQSGADVGVLDALANLVVVKEEEKQMAATRTAAPSRTAAKPAAGVKSGAAKTVAKPAAKAAVKKAPGEKRVTESSRMREMIIAGKLADDQILATIQKEFKGSRAKLSYISWQRNDMRKKGIKFPEAKASKKASASA